jgi:hypothetical protein
MIKTLKDLMTLVFLFNWTLAILWARAYPDSVGEWKAQMDIGYDMIWSEYLLDYTCNGETE